MSERRHDPTGSRQDARPPGPALPAGAVAVLKIAVLALLGIGTRYGVHGDLNAIHVLLSLFFSINLLVCYWEVCLFFRRDYVEKRAEYWRRRRRESGRASTREFLAARVPLVRLLSPTVWADAYAAYTQYDGAYADRRMFGFMVDVGNGFVTPLPTLILYAAYTLQVGPALVAGVVGVGLFWQWTYVTSLYVAGFFVARRQYLISPRDTLIYIWAINSLWIAFALLGMYVSIRLIADGHFGVLGY